MFRFGNNWGTLRQFFEECENTTLRGYVKLKSVRKTVDLKIGVNTEDAEARRTGKHPQNHGRVGKAPPAPASSATPILTRYQITQKGEESFQEA